MESKYRKFIVKQYVRIPKERKGIRGKLVRRIQDAKIFEGGNEPTQEAIMAATIYWMMTLDPEKLARDLRPHIEQYQREWEDVLARAKAQEKAATDEAAAREIQGVLKPGEATVPLQPKDSVTSPKRPRKKSNG